MHLNWKYLEIKHLYCKSMRPSVHSSQQSLRNRRNRTPTKPFLCVAFFLLARFSPARAWQTNGWLPASENVLLKRCRKPNFTCRSSADGKRSFLFAAGPANRLRANPNTAQEKTLGLTGISLGSGYPKMPRHQIPRPLNVQ